MSGDTIKRDMLKGFLREITDAQKDLETFYTYTKAQRDQFYATLTAAQQDMDAAEERHEDLPPAVEKSIFDLLSETRGLVTSKKAAEAAAATKLTARQNIAAIMSGAMGIYSMRLNPNNTSPSSSPAVTPRPR